MRRELKEPSRSRLVLALMWHPEFSEKDALNAASEFGELAERSEAFEFTHTSYYEREMGAGLKKRFVAVNGFCARDSLARHKQRATEIENGYLTPFKTRLLNIDPMLVSLENVVVASSKNFPHRVYLGQGVFGDLALIRRKSGFDVLPWTYPDYAEQRPFFETVFSTLKKQQF